ncbi:MmcQ/YjbR family DNA-binding protein [Streptococcus thermophilus]|uniref:MmcQ/YjbR family DNA-binding protein n=1 Tax=Streptococcus thermophilus TaxID=1308 RepID=UPI0034A0785E
MFSSPQDNRLANFIVKEFSDQADHPFEKYPDYLSFRVDGKWYALFFPLKGDKLALSGEKASLVYDVVNIKVNPRQMDKLLDLDGIYPSYHMSKKTWISLVLDETIPDQTIFELIRGSRSLVAPKHLRKASEPHYWIVPVNLKYYDIGEEFSASEDILWTQKTSMQKGDFVAIYNYGTYQGHPLSLSGFRS